MVEGTIKDTEMVLVQIHPNGRVDAPPQWSVVSGNSTLLSDPAHPAWDASLPDGYQMFLVSETLPATLETADTEYLVQADVDLGDGVQLISDGVLLHVVAQGATSLGITAGLPVPKP